MKKIFASKKVVAAAIMLATLLGVALRFAAMNRGHNFDFESYKIVADIINAGGNVYAETARYNYGPVWFFLLGIFGFVADLFANSELVFRVLVVSILTAADLAIAFILKRKYGVWLAICFFLNPISIIITGFHNQFDNLALLAGFTGVAIIGRLDDPTFSKRYIYGLALIGLSLMIKHLFFIFPLWLFIRATTLRKKLAALLLPIGMFAVGFVPFWSTGAEGIIQNVFLYDSFANAPLLNALISPSILAYINPTMLFVAVLLLAGFLTRRLSLFDAMLWYTLLLVCFAPAIANQYLAIAMPAAVVLGVAFFIPYVLLSTVLLAGTSDVGLEIGRVAGFFPDRIIAYLTPHGNNEHYNIVILSLFLGLLAAAIYRYRRRWLMSVWRYIKREVVYQIKTIKQS